MKSVFPSLPDAKYFAVCRGNGWKRGRTEPAFEHIVWKKALGPSTDLLNRYKSGTVTWDDYRKEYLEQMRESATAQKQIVILTNLVLRGQDIVLMCYEPRGENCHRHLLVDLVLNKIRELRLGKGLYRLNPNGGEILC
jgi:uncharacterized protein YeaO (DUF488 family)